MTIIIWQLFNVSSEGAWHDWLSYFLNGVATQGLDVLSRAERINSLIIDWKIKVGGSLESVAQHIIDHLSVNPYITIKSISQNLNIAFTTASRSIEKLEIITQTSNGKRDKVYCSHEILKILEEPAKILENFDSVL